MAIRTISTEYMTRKATHNIALAKMRAAVVYYRAVFFATVRVLRHDSALNPALRQALKRYAAA